MVEGRQQQPRPAGEDSALHLSPRRESVLRVAQVALLAALTVYIAQLVLGLGFASADVFFDEVVYSSLIVAATALVVWRAIAVRAERAAWAMIALGMATTAFAEVYWFVALADLSAPPYPSLSDLGWLVTYAFWCIGLALLVKARVRRFRRITWLDGMIGALTIGAVGAAFILPTIFGAAGGPIWEAATTAAYPIGDLLLVAFVAGMLILTGWRWELSWALVAAGLIVVALGDTIYEFQAATDAYAPGTLLDLTWPLSVILIALGAWREPPRDPVITPVAGWRSIAAPASFSFVAIGVMVYGYIGPAQPVAVALAAVALLATAARMAHTYRDNQRLSHEAQTDSLTGLGNRGKLMLDLREEIEITGQSGRFVLVMLDLDGFKLYNDGFGHPAGDVLLRRLSTRLAAAVEGKGAAYRIGGDEFCILILENVAQAGELIDQATYALSDRGTGFTVTASYGATLVPDEANNADRALQLADERMYSHKNGSRVSARSQAQQVLMRALLERQPELSEHVSRVGELTAPVAKRFTQDPEELDVIRRAAELHDIGKMAIPDAILAKPESLTEDERAFIHGHTVIGDRILSSAPALVPVAKVVRSSHERWDGDGYPDRLAGDEIPLGSRIIAVCDAFQAMTSDRPYSAAIPVEDAIEELRACAGSQFDPEVVAVACEEIIASDQEDERLVSKPLAAPASR
ncbi:MAG: HD domain-containing phosphohydrolase [Solirubrobacterales bacterium]